MSAFRGKTVSIARARGAGYDAARAQGDNTVGRALSAHRRAAGLSQGAFAALLVELGVNIGLRGYAKWETGETVPNAYQLLAAARALGMESLAAFSADGPELDAEGLRRLREYKEDLIASGRYRPAPAPRREEEWVELPFSRLRPSAGPGKLLEEEEFELRRFPAGAVPPGADFALQADGNSMEPVYADGQLLWVQRCSSLRPGEVGLLRYDGQSYVKLYGEQSPEEDKLPLFTDAEGRVYPQSVLRSYNPAYAPIPVDPEKDFAVLGRVLR